VSAKPVKRKRIAKSYDEDMQLGAEAVEATGLLDASEDSDENSEGVEAPLGGRSVAVKPGGDTPKRLQSLESVFRIVSLAAISASAVIAAYQFYLERVDAKREQSRNLMLSWQSADARESYALLRGELEEALEDQGPIPANIPETAFDDIKYNIGRTIVENWRSGPEDEYVTWSQHVNKVYEFYTEVEFCIQAKLCVEDLLKAYFAEEVVSFWDYFEYFAESQREALYPNYGCSVESLVYQFNEENRVACASE
jgi:hypothetical protein